MCNIMLIDMNSFFASVHQALDPALRGKPVVVCGDPDKRHGIVLAASYEAKKYGVKTTMPKWEAEKLVPDGIYLRPDHKRYLEFSKRIMNIIRDFSPLVEQFSIDEAFVDMAGSHCDIVETAKMIKKRIWEEVGVLCSVGIGPNKVVAKMAAELEKPDGLTLITKSEVPARLWPLPVKKLFGVGGSTQKKLNSLGIYTIGDLAGFPPDILERKLGAPGRALHVSANGESCSSVNPNSHDDLKSIGNQFTLSRDYKGPEIKKAIMEIAEKVGHRVRQGRYMCKTVTLILRETDFTNRTWSHTLSEYTDISEEICSTAVRLFKSNWPQDKKVRLIGVSVSNLVPKRYEQVDLFNEKEKLRKLDNACDQIKKRFGYNSIVRGVSLNKQWDDPVK